MSLALTALAVKRVLLLLCTAFLQHYKYTNITSQIAKVNGLNKYYIALPQNFSVCKIWLIVNKFCKKTKHQSLHNTQDSGKRVKGIQNWIWTCQLRVWDIQSILQESGKNCLQLDLAFTNNKGHIWVGHIWVYECSQIQNTSTWSNSQYLCIPGRVNP